MREVYQYYKRLNEEELLSYLTAPVTYTQIRNCFLDWFYSDRKRIGQDIEEIVRLFIDSDSKETEPIQQLVKNLKPSNFKSIAEFLNGERETVKKSGGIMIAEKLISFDARKRKLIEEKTIDSSDDNAVFDQLKINLNSIYQGHERFNRIKIIGDVGKFLGELFMDEFYIQTTYLSEEDVSDRDTLISLERESSQVKVARKSNYSHDYVNEETLMADRILVIGNPGVGKSTFGRWLCYQSSKREVNDIQLIYVQLRDLDFNASNFLISYINNNYNVQLNTERVLPEKINNTKWVFDGFDELSTSQKNKLISGISNLNYVILSRPYGLIGYSIDYSAAIQIDGFDDIGIDRYITKLVSSKDEPQELMRLLENNRILSSYASNPLMLSYIVLLFVLDNKTRSSLTKVSSVFELQQQVLNWIVNYSQHKSLGNIKALSKTGLFRKFAFDLLLEKKFIYEGNFDDENYFIAEELSQLGIGSLTFQRDSFRWKFAFLTVTIQEFLASQHLIQKLKNREALVYLTTHDFFWNTVALAVGGLSSTNSQFRNTDLLKSYLTFMISFYKSNDQPYYGYSYYLLIAESQPILLNSIIEDEQLDQLIDFYRNTYLDDYWEQTLLGSISRIIQKLHPDKKALLVNRLSKSLEEIPKCDSSDAYRVGYFYYLTEIIELVISYDNYTILKILIKTMIELCENISRWSEISDTLEKQLSIYDSHENITGVNEIEDNYDDAIYNSNWGRRVMSNLFSLLENIPKEQLSKYAESIEQIYRAESTDIFLYKKVIHRIRPNEDLELLKIGYQALLIELRNKGLNPYQTAIKSFDFDFYYFLERIYSFTINSDPQKLRHNDFVIDLISKWSRALLASKTSDHKSKFFLDYQLDLFISSLIKINRYETIELAVQLTCQFNFFLKEKIDKQDVLFDITKNKLKKATRSMSEVDINQFICLVEYKYNQILYDSAFREMLFQFTLKLLKLYARNPKEHEHTVDNSIALFNSNVNRKSLINKLLEAEEFDLYSIPIHRQLFSKFTFYEEKYWNVYHKFLSKFIENIEPYLQLLTCDGLYKFESNHVRLIELYIRMIHLFSDDQFKENSSSFLIGTSKILMILKGNYSDSIIEKIKSRLDKLLSNDDIQKFCVYNMTDLSPIDHVLVFYLYANYSNIHNEFLISLNLDEQFFDEPMAMSEFVDSLINFISSGEHYGIDSTRNTRFKELLKNNPKVLSLMSQRIKQRLLDKMVFDKSHFAILLSSDFTST